MKVRIAILGFAAGTSAGELPGGGEVVGVVGGNIEFNAAPLELKYHSNALRKNASRRFEGRRIRRTKEFVKAVMVFGECFHEVEKQIRYICRGALRLSHSCF